MIEEAAKKIESMEIRGASNIARFAVETLMRYADTISDDFDNKMRIASQRLLNTRPTAVSLFNAINYVMNYQGSNVEEKREDLKRRATEFIHWVDTAKMKIAEIGARRIKKNSIILTHCNSSTAIAVIKKAYDEGKVNEVFVTESRPRLQGLLTVKDLSEVGVKINLIVDSAVRFFIEEIDYVIVGADTITANGALINKIGTSQIALIAKEARVPFIVAAETYKFSPKTLLGELVVIEERDAKEVAGDDILSLNNVFVRNPAFDATPRNYIDLIITEIGAIPPEMAYLIIRERLGYPKIHNEEIVISPHHFE